MSANAPINAAKARHVTCSCGQISIYACGAPIITTECYCSSCRAAAKELGALPAAPTFQEPSGGTQTVAFRKDRVQFEGRLDKFAELRLKPDSTTRRVVAECCNTPLFMEFEKGHWIDLYAFLWPTDERPPLEERTMIADLPDASALPQDAVPSSKRQSMAFYFKLLSSWALMGFRRPKMPEARRLRRHCGT